MRSKYLLFALISVFLWGCGEAGVESDISKLIDTDPIEVNVSVDPFLVNQTVASTPVTTVYAYNVVETEEFEEYLDDAETFTLNFISYTVENFPSGSSADMLLDVSIAIGGGNNYLDLMSLRIDDVQNNPEDVKIYEAGSNLGAVNASTVGQLESALLQGQTFDMRIEISGEDVTLTQPDADFDLIFKYDVTARVQFN